MRDTLRPQTGNVDPAVALMAVDLRDYVGANVSAIDSTIDDQTKQLRGKAADNMDKLEETLAMQRRIIAETLNSGKGMSDLEKEVDEITDSVEAFVQGMAQFSERFGYMSEYSNAEPSTTEVSELDQESDALTVSQRLVLVGLRRDTKAWDKLTRRRSRKSSTVQSAIVALLDSSRTPKDLTPEERAGVNTAMQAELKETVGFSLLNGKVDKLTYSQKKTLGELEGNPDAAQLLSEEEKASKPHIRTEARFRVF